MNYLAMTLIAASLLLAALMVACTEGHKERMKVSDESFVKYKAAMPLLRSDIGLPQLEGDDDVELYFDKNDKKYGFDVRVQIRSKAFPYISSWVMYYKTESGKFVYLGESFSIDGKQILKSGDPESFLIDYRCKPFNYGPDSKFVGLKVTYFGTDADFQDAATISEVKKALKKWNYTPFR